ncbi:MAG: Non-homologous end joining protein Ku [Promethearchaeota archaeon]|jgi:DNA end-binding protein Ku|nr:MAG: Non-homologous end joining protein Ku [Candidatus Lokiarchaeota archaeon]
MKAVWKGYLGFGLVNIPVALYTAVDDSGISFRLLHKKDNGPINYKRVCSECEQEVEWDNIVKGLEVGKDEFYVLTQEEIEELKPESDDLIEIHEFVPSEEIDPLYIHKNYFIGLQEGAERAYTLFKGVIESQDKVAIGSFVMREKKYLCMVKSYKKGLLLTLLNYADDIRSIENVPNIDYEPPELKDKEIELSNQLIENMSADRFELSKYKNTFQENLREAIKKKAKGERVSIHKKKAEKTENLIESLEASLKQK